MATHSSILAWEIHGSPGHVGKEGPSPREDGPPGDLPHQWIEPTSLMSPALAGEFFTTGATWEAPGPRHAHGDLTSLAPHERLDRKSVV